MNAWWLAHGDPLMLALVVVAAALAGLVVQQVLARWLNAEQGHWLGVAAALVAVAPLLGLLGTVSGLIDSFGALGHAADPRAAGPGIARALYTTQLGLLIAIPGLIALALLRRWHGPEDQS